MQHVAFIYCNYADSFDNAKMYLQHKKEWTLIWENLLHVHDFRVTVIQRAPFTEEYQHNQIDYHFVQDSFGQRLGWVQQNDKISKIIADIQPSIVHNSHLDLPLHFRWLRQNLPERSAIIGQYTNDLLWHDRKLWLQQFGLRVADAFFFTDRSDAHKWLKKGVILPCQPVFEIDVRNCTPEVSAQIFASAYRQALLWRRPKN